MNCSFLNNPPEDDTAVCIYIQYQKTLSTSTLVITFSAQAGKQAVPGPAELGQPKFLWTCIPLCLPQHARALPPPLQWDIQVIASALPALRVGNHPPVPVPFLPRVTEVFTGSLSPRQQVNKPRWTCSDHFFLRHFWWHLTWQRESNTNAACSRT